ncbi:hypothetical protein N7448_004511 [Penicillium atrosanguineum]|uniref:Uncharacterized protein n=1 Tax=Penicillium atrosanguineum TaxID=1132637 RepID=A0A9W9PQA4_9EURO|nr:hypothetical protein N7526_007362 [Penicillium atrosanguineum]KAJ5135957.1 hypothetical protein N7448_004511 [Penicillium atrosanguineum]KAJ5303670.1 hypothetical protein N7476_010469 [Penicillium atrosanguineum]
MPKDSPTFRLANTVGEVRFPPCEERDEELARIHEEFQLKPMGEIAKYPRHIPYQSDKKSFQEKTGRDSFHVFNYTFQKPGSDVVWTVMWDYNVGLVRTTHLFKCLGYAKTVPGKALRNNKGLEDICHSITGGAILAQGYWWPYEAAKAMAAQFCWKIRYALTPLFGTDFPSMCIPEGQPSHGIMRIDAHIVAEATKAANFYRSLELQKPRAASSQGSQQRGPHGQQRIGRQRSITYDDQDRQLYRPKFARHSYEDSISSARDSSSEPYCHSPQSPTSSWTPVNVPPRSSYVSPHGDRISPCQFFHPLNTCQKQNMSSECSGSETDDSPRPNFSSLAKGDTKMGKANSCVADVETRDFCTDSGFSGDESDESDDAYTPVSRGSTGDATMSARKNPPRSVRSLRSRRSDTSPSARHFAHEVKAAHALLHLHMQQAEDEHDSLEAVSIPNARKRRCASL